MIWAMGISRTTAWAGFLVGLMLAAGGCESCAPANADAPLFVCATDEDCDQAGGYRCIDGVCAESLRADAGAPLVDAGDTSPDAGVAPPDAGPSTSDAGPSTSDAGPSISDAGFSAGDAASSPSDAGSTVPEGGNPPPDAGPPLQDGGNPTLDSGSPPSDASLVLPDSGIADPEAGPLQSDGGGPIADSGSGGVDAALPPADAGPGAPCDGGTVLNAWRDTDGDGYGDPGQPLSVCGLGSGIVDNDRDCDDGDTNIFPGRPCNDGDDCTQNDFCIDGECTGVTNPGCDPSPNCSNDCGNLAGATCCQETAAGNGTNCPSGAHCDITCTNDSCDNLVCNSGSACTVEADGVSGGPSFNCNDAYCDLQCQSTSGGCDATCQSNATCKLDCDESTGGCNLDCHGGSTCFLECAPNSSDCFMNCRSGAECIMDCSAAPSSCDFSPCEDGSGQTCNNGIITCNLPCPP
jgi:hypothetical protein